MSQVTLSQRVVLFTCDDGGEAGRRRSCVGGGRQQGCGVDVLDSQRDMDLDCDETTG